MPDELRPILEARTTPTPNASLLPPRLYRLTRAVRLLASMAALGSFILSAYYFLGFVENDKGIAHLLNAFVLCFGVGALACVPAFYVARKAHYILGHGPGTKVTLKIAALMLPWVFTGLYLQLLNGLWSIVGLILLALSIIFLWWSAALFKAGRSSHS